MTTRKRPSSLPNALRRPSAPAARQRGVALAIALVLMVAMTVLGVATLSGTRLNERIASNTQQKTLVFEAAESGIRAAWSVDRMLQSARAATPAELDNPAAVDQTDLQAAISADSDLVNAGGIRADIDGSVTIRYCGETGLPFGSSLSADESGLRYAGQLFDVNAVIRMQNGGANADHLQRGVRVGPMTGRGSNCTLRTD